MAWIPARDWQEREWARQDRVFAKKANQGEVTCPMVVTDAQGGLTGVQSMIDGKFYDSKAAMRRHYREVGATEIGNDPALYRKIHTKETRTDPQQEKKIEAALGRAWNRVGLPPVFEERYQPIAKYDEMARQHGTTLAAALESYSGITMTESDRANAKAESGHPGVTPSSGRRRAMLRALEALAADAACVSGDMLGWLLGEQGMGPHIAGFRKTE